MLFYSTNSTLGYARRDLGAKGSTFGKFTCLDPYPSPLHKLTRRTPTILLPIARDMFREAFDGVEGRQKRETIEGHGDRECRAIGTNGRRG